MGGNGSGRQGGRATVERTNSIKLCIHDVMCGFDGVKPIGRKWAWPESLDGEVTAFVVPREGRLPVVELCYRIDHFSRDTGDQAQTVQVEWSPCRFGGKRWWWLCPRTGARVTKLYLPNGGLRFWSRQAYGLAYQSTRGTWLDRAHGTSARLHRKLGWHYDGPIEFFPDKPKGMHWQTYNAICGRIDAVEQLIDRGSMESVGRFLARYGNS